MGLLFGEGLKELTKKVKMNNFPKIIISGGGTGGHIFPAVAIANALRSISPNCEILFVGALGRMEMEKVPAAGYKIVGLKISGIQRGSILKNLTLPFKVLSSVRTSMKLISAFKPHVVVGVGALLPDHYYTRLRLKKFHTSFRSRIRMQVLPISYWAKMQRKYALHSMEWTNFFQQIKY
jgi:UDP:flavonoid glycosyltransferase YjiC (YdhE family)